LPIGDFTVWDKLTTGCNPLKWWWGWWWRSPYCPRYFHETTATGLTVQ